MKAVGLALQGGWLVAVFFAERQLILPVPPLLGLLGAAGVLLDDFCNKLLVKQ